MEQQLDAFTQRRFELMVEMATKKLQQEMQGLKEYISSLNSDIVSLKSQVSRLQFQPQARDVQKTLVGEKPAIEAKKEVEIVDCRPHDQRKAEFKSGAERNTEPIKPRYGDYQPSDVSIDKFFYFGRK